jgi:hypothetical protein
LSYFLAEGATSAFFHTDLLLANPNAVAAPVTITYLKVGGAPVGAMVPELSNESFGANITSDQPIFVERSMYSDVAGVIWAAGTNATAARLP